MVSWEYYSGFQPALILRPWRVGDIRIGERETAEIGCWTAVPARGRGIAPAAVRAVTGWVFNAFAGASMRQIMLVHDIDNQASCRVAEKSGYPFRDFSPANPQIEDVSFELIRGPLEPLRP